MGPGAPGFDPRASTGLLTAGLRVSRGWAAGHLWQLHPDPERNKVIPSRCLTRGSCYSPSRLRTELLPPSGKSRGRLVVLEPTRCMDLR